MYTQYFGLSEKPFSITPDPHFLFLSERHSEALAHLVYGVTESGGFIQLTGEVGTGKTTLTRSLLDRLPATVDLAVILNPRLSVDEFLRAIFDELNIEIPTDTPTTKDLVDALNHYLLQSHSGGRRTVLLVDEAQNLDSDVLEQLRLLTNLETSKDKLLQIILVGQPELRTLLGRNDLRQLAQRITGRYHLQTLNPKESIAYVRHRLQVAGADHEIFSPTALWEVHRLAGGVPRLINVICDRALLGAYTAETPRVSRNIVRQAAAEISGAPVTGAGLQLPVRRIAGVAAAAVLALFGIWGVQKVFFGGTPPNPQQAAEIMTATEDNGSLASPLRTRALSVSERLPPLAVSAAAAEPSGPLEPSLADLLISPAVNTGTDEAFRQLFSLWNEGPPAGGAPCANAAAVGLKCAFQVGSWRLLRTMNRPAILSLVDGNGNPHNALLIALHGSAATLRLGAADYNVSVDEVSRYWLGEFLILWRPHQGADDLMVQGYRSRAVARLREMLERVQGVRNYTSDPNVYDSALRRQVQAFQRSRRLQADGKAGVQTLIAVNTALDLPGTPYLERQ